MVATEGRGRGRRESAAAAAIFLPPPRPETSYNAINLVLQGRKKNIWQLSEFYMKTLPLLTLFSPVSQHLSVGEPWRDEVGVC